MSRRKRNSSSEEEIYVIENEGKGLRKRQQVKYYESSISEDDAVEKPRNKKSGNKSTSSDTDDSSFESGDSDSDFEASYEKKGKGSSMKEKKESMSEYEKQLLEKKNKNLEFLKSIGMDQAKEDILGLKQKKNQKKKKDYSESSNGPKRVSQREKAQINYAEGDDVVDVDESQLTFQKLLKFKKDYEEFVEDFDEVLETDDFVQPPVTYDKGVLKQLSNNTTLPAGKVYMPSALSWYPSSEHLVLAFGNFSGNVALWNVENSDYLHKFEVHSKRVSSMQFNPWNTSHLISSSLDGTLLCCDLQKQKFSEVLRISNSCTCFDFFSPSSYLVSLTSGEVVIVDKRTHGRDEYQHKRYTCHDFAINTINVHPVEKNYFVTAGRDRKFCIWDLRKLTKLPIIENTNYSKSVKSAFFSPLSGKYLLTLSRDIKLCIFDTEKMTEGRMKLDTSIKCEFGDKEARVSMARWLPNSDNLFTWLNGESKQMLKIYDKDYTLYETVDDGIKGIRETVAFHPFKPAIASVSQVGAIRISAEEINT